MKELIYLQISISFAIVFTGSLFLFLKSEGIRSRRILGWILAIWCTTFAIRLAGPLLGLYPIAKEVYMSPLFLIHGPFLALLMLFYVIEILRPGWINWRRGLYIALPWLICSAFYPFMLWVLNEPYTSLNNFDELRVHITEFNVWFRFVLFLMTYAYLYLLHTFTLRYRHYYDKWCADNYVSTEQMDISWLRYVAIGMLVITLLYSCMLFNVGLSLWAIHQVVIQFIFLIVFYHGLYHENPYTDTFFEQTLDEETALDIYESNHFHTPKDEDTFAEHLPEYILIVEEWMKTTQPYLRPNFKLQDVEEILPFNRTYLSRVFNEGFALSFSQFVQNYRIEKAQEILRSNQQMSIKEVLFDCGFSSVSTFHSTFQKKTGMTPMQYRQSMLSKTPPETINNNA